MKQIGIFFGTDSGTTRLIAKKIAKNLKGRIGQASLRSHERFWDIQVHQNRFDL
ncbi:MAG: hypothetical protein ABW095_07630 [Candidatus Thiodiazotropha sp.]